MSELYAFEFELKQMRAEQSLHSPLWVSVNENPNRAQRSQLSTWLPMRWIEGLTF